MLYKLCEYAYALFPFAVTASFETVCVCEKHDNNDFKLDGGKSGFYWAVVCLISM